MSRADHVEVDSRTKWHNNAADVNVSVRKRLDMRNFVAVVTRKGEHAANIAVQSYRDETSDELDTEKRDELRAEMSLMLQL